MTASVLNFRTPDGFEIIVRKPEPCNGFEDSDYSDYENETLEELTLRSVVADLDDEAKEDYVDEILGADVSHTDVVDKASEELLKKHFSEHLVPIWRSKVHAAVNNLLMGQLKMRWAEHYVFVSADGKNWEMLGRLVYKEHDVWEKTEFDTIDTTSCKDSYRTYTYFVHKNPLVRLGVRIVNKDVFERVCLTPNFSIYINKHSFCTKPFHAVTEENIKSACKTYDVYIAKQALPLVKHHNIVEFTFKVDYE